MPTPFHLLNGAAHHQTLVMPKEVEPGKEFFPVGDLVRREAAELIIGYSFDLRTNCIVPEKVPNPGAGTEHAFRAWRFNGSPSHPVSLRSLAAVAEELEVSDEDIET